MAARIALFVYPGFQPMDLGVLQAFACANEVLGSAHYVTELVSCDGGTVATGLGVTVESQALGRKRYDTILAAGGVQANARAAGPWVDGLVRVAPRARRMGAMGSGVWLLAQGGLLEGSRATVPGALAREFRQAFAGVLLEEDRFVVHDGDWWTAAGMSAGLDLALALIEDDWGADAARDVARRLLVAYPRTGGQSQFATWSELAQEPDSDRIRRALDFVRDNLRAPLNVEQLADQVQWSARHFSRAFVRETGMTPAKAVERLRLEAAKALIEQGQVAIAHVAARTGFGDEERMRRAFLRTIGQPPQALLRQARAQAAQLHDSLDTEA